MMNRWWNSPTNDNSRSAARALAIRSMYHLGQGPIDRAWSDALAVHRRARLIAQGPSAIEQIVAKNIDEIAVGLDAANLNRQPTAQQLDVMRHDLSRLGPCCNFVRAIDRFERFAFLEAVTDLAEGRDAAQVLGVDDEVLQIVMQARFDYNVLLDLFTETPFRYERRGDGYLLYSVGPNQQDDEGTSWRDSVLKGEHASDLEVRQLDPTEHDDIAIRLPLPEFCWQDEIDKAGQ